MDRDDLFWFDVLSDNLSFPRLQTSHCKLHSLMTLLIPRHHRLFLVTLFDQSFSLQCCAHERETIDHIRCYNCHMSEPPHEQMTVRVIRDGQPEPLENEWLMTSPEERIEAVWTLTKLCMAWNEHSDREPRLQRTITRVQRARGPIV